MQAPLRNKSTKLAVFAVLLLFSVFSAAANYSGSKKAPQPSNCFKVDVGSSGGNAYWHNIDVKLTNTCSETLNISQTTIQVNYPVSLSYSSLTPPAGSWVTSYKTSTPTPNTYEVLVNIGGKHTIAQGQSMDLQYGSSKYNPDAIKNSLKVWLSHTPPVNNHGEIVLHAPAAPDSSVAQDKATAEVYGPNSFKQPVSIAWKGKETLKNLAYGDYKVEVNNVGSYPAKPKEYSFNLTKQQPKKEITFTYGQPIQKASLEITMPSYSNLPNRSVMLQDTSQNSLPEIVPLAWGKTTTLDNLVAGDSYKLWTTTFTNNNLEYVPNYTQQHPAQFTANKDKPVKLTISYEQKTPPITIDVPVKTKISGLPQGAEVEVTFTGTGENGKTYRKKVSNGEELFAEMVPGVYNVAAANYKDGDKTYRAQLDNPYTIDGSTSPIKIIYSDNPVATNIYAPYKDLTLNTKWSNKKNAMVPESLTAIAAESHVKALTLAFLVAQNANTCQVTWGGQASYPVTAKNAWGKDDIEAFRKKNHVIISLGGQTGIPLAEACNQTQSLLDAYKTVISAYDVYDLDFDVEGAALENTAANQRRADALMALQKLYPSLKISYTLPVLPSGLTPSGYAVLSQAAKAGVKIARVNIMAMDYGSVADPNTMGKNAIEAATNVFKQLKNGYAGYPPIFPSLSGAQVWARIGITPMIGLNDVHPEVFTLNNASQVLNFAEQKGIGYLASWSINRDISCKNDRKYVGPDCSGITQQPYAFANVFNQFDQ